MVLFYSYIPITAMKTENSKHKLAENKVNCNLFVTPYVMKKKRQAFALTFSVGEAERGSAGALHPLCLQRDVVLQQSVFLQQVLHLQQVFPKVGGQEPSLAGKEAVSSATMRWTSLPGA